MSNEMKRIKISELNVAELVKTLEKCKGRVFLITDEGDKLNLKSTLCGVVGVLKFIKEGQFQNAEIECEDLDDVQLLFRLNLYGYKE
jgi:hypothetical protein